MDFAASRLLTPVKSMSAAIAFTVVMACWQAGCTSGDLVSSNSNGTSSPTNTSVPVSQVGNLTTQASGSSGQPSGLMFPLVQQPNLCIGVESVAIGANLVIRPCDSSATTLFSFANGQLRMNNTFCVGVPSQGVNPTAITVQDSLSLMTCDTSNTTQHFDIQPQGAFGITLANGTRWDLSTVSNYNDGPSMPVLLVAHQATSQYRFAVAAASGGTAGIGGKFAICSAAGDACLGLNSSGIPAVQPRSSAANIWQASVTGRLTDMHDNCLSFDSAGNMTLPLCGDDAAQQVASYNGQMWALGPNMCVSWGSSPTFASAHVSLVPCADGTATPMVYAPVQ